MLLATGLFGLLYTLVVLTVVGMVVVSFWRGMLALEAMRESLQHIERHLRDGDRSAGEPHRASRG